MSFKSIVKGWLGEVQGTLAKKIFLDPNIYVDVNNVIIPTTNSTTQIDHVIISRYGIFVVETKNMKGWIFGDEKNPQWTQNLFGKKFKFQNPLHQNYRHTKALSDFLGIEHVKFFSIVMFWGECEFKTTMPSNVMTSGYVTYIKNKTATLFSDEEVQEISTAIKEGMLPKSWATRRQHVASLKERFANTTSCPKCDSPLVLRTAKSGTNAGTQFYGCSKYPTCHYVAKLEANP
jgi:restriction system protein